MHTKLRHAFEDEIATAVRHLEQGGLALAFLHAQRAHVLGQKYVMPHVRTHCLMLRLTLVHRVPREVGGQLMRIFLGALGSALGLVPTRNTGGYDISMFQRLPIDTALSKIISGD